MPVHVVKRGECLSAIAEKYGLVWEKIWDHADNQSLREKRKDPNVLHPGDEIFVPDKAKRDESKGTEERHRFQRKGVPVKLRLTVKRGGDPLADLAYELVLSDRTLEGRTDGDGFLEETVPPRAEGATLLLDDGTELRLEIGGLDPLEEVSGVQGRLNNLGFHCGPNDGIAGPMTRAALHDFQRENDLDQSGEVDDPTRSKLEEMHGC